MTDAGAVSEDAVSVGDHHHDLAGEIGQRTVLPVDAVRVEAATRFALRDALDHLCGDVDAPHEVVVHHHHQLANAPIARSTWPGTPSLRTRNTSSGAGSAIATS